MDYISEIEEIADESFYSHDFPEGCCDFVVWHFFTVSEDFTRFHFSKVIDNDPREIMVIVDQIKYSLKHVIKRAISESKRLVVRPRFKIDGDCHRRCFDVLNKGIEYEKLCKLMASLYEDGAEINRSGDVYSVNYKDGVSYGYSALEYLGHGSEPEADVIGLLYWWISDDEMGVEAEKVFSKIARLKNRRIVYPYEEDKALYLANRINQRPKIFPDEFNFSWGGAMETHAMINSLIIRCFYHVLTVCYFSRKVGLKGGGDSNLVWVVDRKNLIEDIEVLANVGRKKVECFVEFITYGNRTKNPGPSLQPLFLSDFGLFYIPCFHLITSNVQRNILSLYARVNKEKFDSQSGIFESSMVSRISKIIPKRYRFKCNEVIRAGGDFEELDLLIFDEVSKFIIVGEMRWMIPPGDSREVHNKVRACEEKVLQLHRKVGFVKKNVSSIIGDYIGEFDFQEWSVGGVVIVEGYAGIKSDKPEIPVVTLSIFKAGVEKGLRLYDFYRWCCSLCWLPKKGVHYRPFLEDFDMGDKRLSKPSMLLLADQAEYFDHVLTTLESNSDQ